MPYRRPPMVRGAGEPAGPGRPAPPGGPPSAGRRRRRWPWVVAVLAVLVVAWAAAAAAALVRADRQLHRAEQELSVVKQHLSAADAVAGTSIAELTAAHADFASADATVHSALLDPLDVVPVVGRQLGAVRQLAADADGVTGVGIGALERSKAILDRPHAGGAARLATVDQLVTLADGTVRQLAPYRPDAADALVGPVASAHATFSADYSHVVDLLDSARSSGAVLAGILRGPDRYLLLVTDNAEMRDGSGAPLDVGLLQGSDGDLQLSDLTPAPLLELPAGRVQATGDLAARWGWLLPTADWLNLGVDSQFDVTASAAASMWRAETGQTVAGVVAVDVVGLKDLLEVTGPVATTQGVTVSAGNAERVLFHDQYVNLPSVPGATEANNPRQDMLGSLADAVAQAVNGRSLDLRKLAVAGADATAGRHLLVWSAAAATEADWRRSGVAGQLPADTLMAGVINRGGNKLDQYLGVSVHLTFRRSGPDTVASLTVSLANRTPPGQVQYIAGPYPGLGTVYGEYVGYVALNLPGDVRTATVVGGAPPTTVAGPEGSTWLEAVPVDLKAGTRTQVQVDFTLPGHRGTLDVLPSARATPVAWQAPGRHFTDNRPTTLDW